MAVDKYIHGHDESVLRSHTVRTIANSAAYLEPAFGAGLDILDVGCGPGTITVEFAQRVGSSGSVTGIEVVDDVLVGARERATAAGVDNCTFERGDVYELAYAENTFDVVHAHQVLQHLSDPVAALVEMRRVVKPGGVVAVRDADYQSFAWAPDNPALDRWLDMYVQIARAAACEPNAGRYLYGWARQAGFATVEASTSTWTYATPATRTWWGGLWADRMLHSNYAEQTQEQGLCTEAELSELSAAWRAWSVDDDSWFFVPHGEVLARG